MKGGTHSLAIPGTQGGNAKGQGPGTQATLPLTSHVTLHRSINPTEPQLPLSSSGDNITLPGH